MPPTTEEPGRRETRSSALKDLLTPSEISALSNDSKALYKALEKSIAIHIKSITDHYDALLSQKDHQIQCLTEKVGVLESSNTNLVKKLSQLETELDETAQYQRRDTLIFSGNVVPIEGADENSAQVIADAVASHLKVPFSTADISIAHRLGKKRDDNISRPIIVKLISRSKKAQIVRARIALPKPTTNSGALVNNGPVLHVNESLTPVRRNLFYKLRQLRKKHPSLFKQLYTQDGKITIKLSATNDRKFIITSEQHLLKFLEVSPVLKDTYDQLI